jgi:hypothetical protein
MNTVLIWLLVSVGHNGSYAFGTGVVERFATVQDCEAAAAAIRDAREFSKPVLRCVQTRVVRP